jgi:hypothetical protein
MKPLGKSGVWVYILFENEKECLGVAQQLQAVTSALSKAKKLRSGSY